MKSTLPKGQCAFHICYGAHIQCFIRLRHSPGGKLACIGIAAAAGDLRHREAAGQEQVLCFLHANLRAVFIDRHSVHLPEDLLQNGVLNAEGIVKARNGDESPLFEEGTKYTVTVAAFGYPELTFSFAR